MKSINDFFATTNIELLSVNEMVHVKGGDVPPVNDDDPFEGRFKR